MIAPHESLVPPPPPHNTHTPLPSLQRGVAVVIVGFPATPLLTSRMRICISAAHTQADLDYALEVMQTVAEDCMMRYSADNARHLDGRKAQLIKA